MTSYSLYLLLRVLKEIDNLPGHVRQQVRRAVRQLPFNPEPPDSKRLDYVVKSDGEVRRLKFGSWPVIYVIDRDMKQVYVVGVRKRPPYQDDDLNGLMMQID
jgi:mRNA-degrading endonuclease RelE of RelBE toxin-antitoxin system